MKDVGYMNNQTPKNTHFHVHKLSWLTNLGNSKEGEGFFFHSIRYTRTCFVLSNNGGTNCKNFIKNVVQNNLTCKMNQDNN